MRLESWTRVGFCSFPALSKVPYFRAKVASSKFINYATRDNGSKVADFEITGTPIGRERTRDRLHGRAGPGHPTRSSRATIARLQLMCGPGPSAASSTAARHSRLIGKIGGIGAVSGSAVAGAIESISSVLDAFFMKAL